MSGGELQVKFWGVRGSLGCGGAAWARYGGNTPCLEVRCGPHSLIFDAGSGLRNLGKDIGGTRADLDIILSHSHWDHVCGLPFFGPIFVPSNRVRIWSGHLKGVMTTRELIDELMRPPLFPVAPEIFNANVQYMDFEAGDVLRPRPGVTIRTQPLNHPNGATGFRIEYNGRSVCYVTDTEHLAGQRDQVIVDLIKDCDLFIYDATYTDEEMPGKVGWGHSTWQEGVRLAEAAGVKTYAVFHHDPEHDDDFMDKIAIQVQEARPGSIVAKEGLVITL